MIREYPEYYKDFVCVGGRCPDSCCIGWEVDIDEETFYYYRTVQGPFGRRLNEHMTDTGEEKYFPMTAENRCPFLNERNLCDIILNLGEESLCQVCTEYPRYYLSFGNYEQIDMSLSCMEAGRLFFSSEDPVRYCREEFPGESASPLSVCTDGAFSEDPVSGSGQYGSGEAENGLPAGEAEGGIPVWEADDGLSAGKAESRIPLGEETEGLSAEEAECLKALLHARTTAVETLEDRREPFERRMQSVLGQDPLTGFFAPDLPETERESDEQLLYLMSRLEVLDERWIRELEAVNRELEAVGREQLSAWLGRKAACPEPEAAGRERKTVSPEPETAGRERGTECRVTLQELQDCGASASRKEQIWFEKLAVYYVFRYFPDAFPDGRPEEEKRFIRRCLRFTALMCAARKRENAGRFTTEDMIDAAHLYSKEVEHSEENVEYLKRSFRKITD